MFERTRSRTLAGTIAGLTLAVTVLASTPARAQEDARERAERRFTVMSYNLYLGANLQPLFNEPDPIRLVQKAGEIFAHLDLVDFRVRAVAIAEQIVEQDPDAVSLQEVSLWEKKPPGSPFETTYDFLDILLDELDRQGHPFRSVSISEHFTGTLPIDFSGTLGRYTDRNAIIVPVDRPVSELVTSNPMDGTFEAGIPISLAGTPAKVTRGWSSADVMIRGKTYRLIDTHFEGFVPLVRTGQVHELVQIAAESPYPVVLAGDLNVYPQGMRPEDAQAWAMLSGAGFVDAWVEADCFEPRFTAGQTDDLDNVPSALDNTVDYVLFDADEAVDLDAVEDSCDIAGEELDDRTGTDPSLWPSDHAAAIVDLHIARP